MIRDGDLDPNWQFGVGALWFDGSQGAITGPVNVSNALIEQSPTRPSSGWKARSAGST